MRLWQNYPVAAVAALSKAACHRPRRSLVRVPPQAGPQGPVCRLNRCLAMADETGHLPRGPARVLKATVWSLQGLKAAWLHESSFRLEVCLLVALAPLALWLGDDGVQRALLLGSCLMVLAVELLNSAIEAVIERYGPEQHVLAGRAKDMGSAAVFVSMLNVLLVWGLILAPRWL